MLRLTLGLFIAFALASAAEFPRIQIDRVFTGLQQPLDIAHAGDGSGRLFFLEQRGRVRVAQNGVITPTPVLDIVARVSCCGERGLLGIAFPPGFAVKRYFYLNYTDIAGNTVVSRWRLSSDPNRADPATETVLLRVQQPFANHNGGNLKFGPDGFLYIGLGDGGSANDPQGNGQNTGTFLGKMLRIDTESASATYTVPPSNPFTGNSAYRPEIWATGLRNPWRYSFDRQTGDLWIGDVGQNRAEEIDLQPASSRGGENYGWNRTEGLQCLRAPCDTSGLTPPVIEYSRERGDCSVTGGYVYRGSQAALRGIYLYADYCTGRIWGLQRDGMAWQNQLLLETGMNIATFGEDEAGELYFSDLESGSIHRITAVGSASGPRLVNAASFAPNAVAGSLASFFGTGITAGSSGVLSAASLPLPLQIGNVSVTLNGVAAPLLAIANVNGQEQINLQVPFELAGTASASLLVTANGQSTAPVTVNLASAQPELFIDTAGYAVPYSASNRAVRGQTITLYATGLGAVSNAPRSGAPAAAQPLSETRITPEVLIGGRAAPVSFSGLAPGFAGLFQIDVALPAATAAGDVEVQLRMEGVVSRTVRLAVQ